MEHRKYLDRKDEEGVQSEGWISKRKRKSIKPAWSHRYMKVSNRAILMANSPPDIALSSKVFGLHTLRRVYSSRDEHGNPTDKRFLLGFAEDNGMKILMLKAHSTEEAARWLELIFRRKSEFDHEYGLDSKVRNLVLNSVKEEGRQVKAELEEGSQKRMWTFRRTRPSEMS